MTHFSIANKINDNIVMVNLSVLGCSLEHEINILHTVSVYMKDRSIYSFSEI